VRKAYKSSVVVMDGEVIAVNLGSDQCAEHEWGINTLRMDFGCNDDPLVVGLERRKIGSVPAHLSWQSDGRNGGMRGMWCPERPWRNDKACLPDFANFRVGKLATAWDERSFAAFSSEREEVAALQVVYEALQRGDGALWLGGGGIFQNAGLCIGIASRLPASVVKLWEEKDNEAIKLKNAMLATGIEAKLSAANRRYFALSPAFKSDGSLHFWLNPCEQHIHQHGWVTLRDLEDWILGKGKCMKSGGKR